MSSKDTENSQKWFQIKTFKQRPAKTTWENWVGGEQKTNNICFVLNSELVHFKGLCENKRTAHDLKKNLKGKLATFLLKKLETKDPISWSLHFININHAN